MKFDKSKITISILGFLVLGLTLLLVRENEGRVSAETKLNDLKYRMEKTTNENDNVISDLRNTIHEQEARIADLTARYQAEITDKAGQIRTLNAQIEDEAAKYEGMAGEKDKEISDLQAKSQADNTKLNRVIKEKSARINELGDVLEKASARYAVLLKEKESFEAKTLSQEADISSLKSELKKHQRERERLSQAIQALTKAPETAHD